MKRTAILLAIAASLAWSGASAEGAAFTLRDIDGRLAPLIAHASNYPPHFDSKVQRTLEEQQLRDLMGLLRRALDTYPNDRGLLSRFARANALGHNLDIEGCAQAAIDAYERLLQSDPTDANSEYLYGGFLAGTTLYARSVSHLLRAIQLGIMDAHYPLAFVYVTMKQPEKALTEFRAYLEIDQNNKTAIDMIRRLEAGTGTLQVREVPLEPRNAPLK